MYVDFCNKNRYLLSPEEGVTSLGDGVPDGCDTIDIDSGK